MYTDVFTIGDGYDPSNVSSVIARRSGATINPFLFSAAETLWMTWQTVAHENLFRGFILEFKSFKPIGMDIKIVASLFVHWFTLFCFKHVSIVLKFNGDIGNTSVFSFKINGVFENLYQLFITKMWIKIGFQK